MIECGDRYEPSQMTDSLMGIRCRVLRPVRTAEEQKTWDEIDAQFASPPDASDTHVVFTLCGPGVPRHDEPTDEAPALVLRWMEGACGVPGRHHYAEPPHPPIKGQAGHYTGGSNFLTDEGSSIPALVRPMRIHDRFQPQRA